MKLNCIVVDDSAIQRLSISKLIDNHYLLNLVAEHSNALEIKKLVNSQKIDLLFLDIEMPVINGFELLDSLIIRPQVIFVSNKTEYAFKAFDYNATDYLQKPIEKYRFDIAVEKAVKQHKQNSNVKDVEGEHIYVKSNLKKRKVYINDIKWVEAMGDYIKLVTQNTSFVILSTMRAFEKELPNEIFLRIHKSYIVNIDKIDRFNSKIVEIDGYEVPLSRNKKQRLEAALKKDA